MTSHTLLGIPKGVWEEILHRVKNMFVMINVHPDYTPVVLRITNFRFDRRLVDWAACSRCRPKGIKDGPTAHQRHWMGAMASNCQLPELILDIYIDLLDLDMINRRYTLSDEFLEKHLDKFLDEYDKRNHDKWELFLTNQRPGMDFLYRHRRRISKGIWLHIIQMYGQHITNEFLYTLVKNNIIKIKHIVDNPRWNVRKSFIIEHRLLFMNYFAQLGTKANKKMEPIERFTKLLQSY